jgi:hypothetical protein
MQPCPSQASVPCRSALVPCRNQQQVAGRTQTPSVDRSRLRRAPGRKRAEAPSPPPGSVGRAWAPATASARIAGVCTSVESSSRASASGSCVKRGLPLDLQIHGERRACLLCTPEGCRSGFLADMCLPDPALVGEEAPNWVELVVAEAFGDEVDFAEVLGRNPVGLVCERAIDGCPEAVRRCRV